MLGKKAGSWTVLLGLGTFIALSGTAVAEQPYVGVGPIFIGADLLDAEFGLGEITVYVYDNLWSGNGMGVGLTVCQEFIPNGACDPDEVRFTACNGFTVWATDGILFTGYDTLVFVDGGLAGNNPGVCGSLEPHLGTTGTGGIVC